MRGHLLRVLQKSAVEQVNRDAGCAEGVAAEIRNELDVLVAVPYGKRAYKTSTDDQLSIDSINKRFAELKISAAPLIAGEHADWDRVSEAVVEAKELQRRLSSAVKAADEDELDPLRVIADAVSTLKRELDGLIVEMPAQLDCSAEVEAALSDFTQKLFRAFRQRLAPAEWQRAREVLVHVSGEEPK
jgi:hypothetical protein